MKIVLAENDAEKDKRVTFLMVETPEKVIKEKVNLQAPSGYPMTIRNQENGVL